MAQEGERDFYKGYVEGVEEMASGLYSPDPDHPSVQFPVAWARLRIDMTLMSEENRRKVYEAEMLLREAGVRFDNSSGGGVRDWELDWSLSGASIQVRPIHCQVHSRKPCKMMGGCCYWWVSGKDDVVQAYSYCSEEHRSLDVQNPSLAEGVTTLLLAETEIMVTIP